MPLLLLISAELFVDNDSGSVNLQVLPVYLGFLLAPQECHGCICGILPTSVEAHVDMTEYEYFRGNPKVRS